MALSAEIKAALLKRSYAIPIMDMNIRFLAPCLTDVTARARVIKLGRTLCPVAVDVFDANDRQVAIAQVSYSLNNP
jgi:uncharacterized protein (TIGR00369 family)